MTPDGAGIAAASCMRDTEPSVQLRLPGDRYRFVPRGHCGIGLDTRGRYIYGACRQPVRLELGGGDVPLSHRSLGTNVTRAMAAGISDPVWMSEEIVALPD